MHSSTREAQQDPSERPADNFSFRTVHDADGVATLKMSEDSGVFLYSFNEVIEVRLEDNQLVAPPISGVWLPPAQIPLSIRGLATRHCLFTVHSRLCTGLAGAPCTLSVSPLMRAILDHLSTADVTSSPSMENLRLYQVLLDQLIHSEATGSYLPYTTDPLLVPILRLLENSPGDTPKLPALAELAKTTERTLARRAQKNLGMSLAEWKQRLRIVKAISLLNAAHTVEEIASHLGYSSASAFIAMFHRLMGVPPDEFRHRKGR